MNPRPLPAGGDSAREKVMVVVTAVTVCEGGAREGMRRARERVRCLPPTVSCVLFFFSGGGTATTTAAHHTI